MFARAARRVRELVGRALDDEIERLELEARALTPDVWQCVAAAELSQTPALDGHKSTQAYLRATTNQPAAVVLGEVRRARLCRDFPQIGEALMSGRIGVGQIDELVRITRNQRAARYPRRRTGRDVVRARRTSVDPRLRDGRRPLVDVGRPRRRVAAIRPSRSTTAPATSSPPAAKSSIGAVGGDVLTAETLTNIFAHFVEVEFRKDCETRNAEHGERADEFALPRTDAQRRFDALVGDLRAGLRRHRRRQAARPGRQHRLRPAHPARPVGPRRDRARRRRHGRSRTS